MWQLVEVQNERLLEMLPPDTPIEETLFAADEVTSPAHLIPIAFPSYLLTYWLPDDVAGRSPLR
jgi:hypothetical protein